MAIPVDITWRGHMIFYFLKLFSLMICFPLAFSLFGDSGSVTGWVPIIILIGIVIKFIFPMIDGLSAMSYIRFVLKTQIEYDFAYQNRAYFVPNTSGVWYPLSYIADLPSDQRLDALKSEIAELNSQH